MKKLNKFNNLNSSKSSLKVYLVENFSKMSNEYQRHVILFLWKKGNNVDQIYQELCITEGDEAPHKRTVYRWVEKFRCGIRDVKTETPPGPEITARTDRNIDRIRKLLEEDRRSSIRLLAELIGTSTWVVYKILHEDLGLSRVCCRWVPRMLTGAMKAKRVEGSESILNFIDEEEENFCTRYSTMDESWLYLYDPDSKQQSSVWIEKGSNPPVKFKADRSVKKVMATVFWDFKGIIYVEYLVGGGTVTGARFANSVRNFREEVTKKRRGKVRAGLVLHMDNAPVHTALVAKAAIREADIELLSHPPYSPDLAPSDYWLFPNLKKALKGRRFKDTSDVIEAANQWFEDQSEEFYKTGVMKLRSRCEKCILVRGDYVEKC